MTKETKIKIGKVSNVTSTIIFVIFVIVAFVGIDVSVQTFIIISAVLMVLFAISCIIGHVCLKDYKEE